jgi:hypothetical protein
MFAAGYIGFDFENIISDTFMQRWEDAMLKGIFNGSWDNSRHDMVCASIIANQMNIVKLYSSCGNLFSYVGEVYGKPKETAVFYLQGI